MRKVKKRVKTRKQDKQSQLQGKDLLIARLRSADVQIRPALEEELSRMIASMQSANGALDLHNYIKEFEAVLLNQGQHLRLNQPG